MLKNISHKCNKNVHKNYISPEKFSPPPRRKFWAASGHVMICVCVRYSKVEVKLRKRPNLNIHSVVLCGSRDKIRR